MQLTIFESKEKFKINKPVRLIELFAGIGSQAQALKNINIEFSHYKVIEYDKFAIKAYNAIHGTNFFPVDIKDITASTLGIVDTHLLTYLLTYSFPCQDLSVVGKKVGMSKDKNSRSGLLWEVERLLNDCENLPQILLMENVPLIHGKKNFQDFQKWILFLEKLGYSNYWQDLNAKNYGVAQSRNRTFMISILGDYYYQFPRGVKLDKTLKDYLETKVDDKYFISDKLLKCFTDMTNRNGFIRGERFQPHKIDSRLAYTITTRTGLRATDNFIKCDDGKIRKLTEKECMRLMGWQDDEINKQLAVVSSAQSYKQAGNGIVIPVLEQIFKKLLE